MLFDNYTLEELEQFRENPKKMNKEQLSKLQEMLGITADGVFGPQTAKALQEKLGVKADGKWGPKSNAAYVDAYNQSFDDEAQYQKAISQGKTNPLVQDFTDFYNNGYEQYLIQEQGRHEKIAKLEEQIAQVEERINRNKRALYGKSYEDVNNKLAQLELDKIGFRFNGQQTNTDPTSFWRWNQARQDTKESYDKQNQNTFTKWANSANALLKQDINPYNFEDMRYQLKTIREMIANGQTIGVSDSQLVPLLEREKELDEKVKNEYINADNKKKTLTKIAELDKRLANSTIKPAEYNVEIQKLLDEAGTDIELIETLKTKLQYGKKKATPSSVPQI